MHERATSGERALRCCDDARFVAAGPGVQPSPQPRRSTVRDRVRRHATVMHRASGACRRPEESGARVCCHVGDMTRTSRRNIGALSTAGAARPPCRRLRHPSRRWHVACDVERSWRALRMRTSSHAWSERVEDQALQVASVDLPLDTPGAGVARPFSTADAAGLGGSRSAGERRGPRGTGPLAR